MRFNIYTNSFDTQIVGGDTCINNIFKLNIFLMVISNEEAPFFVSLADALQMDGPAFGGFSGLHDRFVHCRMGVDRAGDSVRRCTQRAGQRRFRKHLRDMGPDHVGAE